MLSLLRCQAVELAVPARVTVREKVAHVETQPLLVLVLIIVPPQPYFSL
jgi:hypothetical protein